MKADYLEFKDKCIQMLTEIGFLNQVQMTVSFRIYYNNANK